MDTLYLNVAQWDLALDSSGNIALASNPYALAQDAASAIRTFEGECFYDTSIGVPYWRDILGKLPALSVVKSEFVKAALTVPEVVEAVVFISSVRNRTISGQVQLTDVNSLLVVGTF